MVALYPKEIVKKVAINFKPIGRIFKIIAEKMKSYIDIMKRYELINVYKDTVNLSKKTTSHSYKQSEKWNFSEDLPPGEEIFKNATPYDQPAKVTVVNADTLTTAIDLSVKYNLNPLVLNMASNMVPGGGVAKGSRAQEEELYRRTNYSLCIDKSLYPIKDTEFIITDDVTVVKDENYQRLDDYYEFDFIAIPAVRKPALEYGDEEYGEYMEVEEQQLMSDKIDAIFRYALYQEKDSLVLGALGCGAYGNPPDIVCKMFQTSLDKYRYYFINITFAVLSKDRCHNYDIFKKLS